MLHPLTPDQLKKLTSLEQQEYLEHLEALHRASGKDSFLKFVGMVDTPGAPMNEPEPDTYYSQRLVPATHHKLIIDAFQSMTDGQDAKDGVDGLMLFMRPGSAKSTYASVLAPAWIMGNRPGTNVIACSYGQELANRFARRVRTICRSSEFSDIMGCSITGDNQAVDNWSLTNGSDYRATGIGAAITGFRSDWLIIDDPVKDREAADSATIQDKTWNSYLDDLTTRLKPSGKIALIMTRWNQRDLGGMILGEEWTGQSGLWRGSRDDGRLWRIINLPYVSEHLDDPLGRVVGERMWAEHFTQAEAERLQTAAAKGGSASRAWNSLYQQRPAPAEGAIMLRSYWLEWKRKTKVVNADGEIKEITDPPECEFVILAYDTAFEEDEQNDPSAMTAWGVFPSISTKKTGEQYHHNHVILLGSWEGYVQAADLADIIVGHYKHFRPHVILIEKRASGAQIIQELKRLRLPVKAWLPKGKPGAKGKVPRAHAVAMMLEQGAVHYIPGKENQKTIDQCAAVGGGAAHDDRADTVTCALSYFRDRFMFQTADEEMDENEHKIYLKEQMDRNRMGRRLYSGDHPQRRAQNERRLYSEVTRTRVQDESVERMTDETRRRLYGE